MRFSVIVPVYNVEDYLEECLASILDQTFRDFEIILIDDGSTDRSGEICNVCALQYGDCIKVHHQQNQGLVKTRVTGLKMAAGEICVFLDSDDALRLDALEVIDRAFRNTECDLALYGVSRDEAFVSEAYMLPFEKGTCFEGADKKRLLSQMLLSGKMNSVSVKAAKKTVYEEFLHEYDTDLNITNGEDLHLSMPLMTYAKKITWLGEKLYFYRPREGSMVNSFNPALHHSVKLVRMELEHYIDVWGIQSSYPFFYSGVVRNWIHAGKKLLKNQKSLKKEEVMTILEEMSEDAFFRKAYRRMMPERLSQQDRILAGWLYRGKLQRLRVVGNIVYSVKKK